MSNCDIFSQLCEVEQQQIFNSSFKIKQAQEIEIYSIMVCVGLVRGMMVKFNSKLKIL